jgi:DNA-binding Xre family transcriptional regulator
MIERGEINTTVSTLKKIADVLKVKPKDLLDF